MPLIRKSNINPVQALSELITHLQLQGLLDHLEVPPSAIGGSSLEELIMMLRTVGNGAWLTGVYEGVDAAGATQKWMTTFLSGEPVPTPDDSDYAEEQELLSMESIKAQFAHALPGEEDRIFARLDDENDLGVIGPRHISGLAESMAVCAILPENDYASHEHPCLAPSRVEDRDLLAVSLYYLGHEETLMEFAQFGDEFVDQAKTRTKALRSELAKLASRN